MPTHCDNYHKNDDSEKYQNEYTHTSVHNDTKNLFFVRVSIMIMFITSE